jgi:hypothetical protein
MRFANLANVASTSLRVGFPTGGLARATDFDELWFVRGAFEDVREEEASAPADDVAFDPLEAIISAVCAFRNSRVENM